VYQGGRYVLEDVAAVPKDQSGPTIHCGGRMVFYTSWGIVVRNVAYDVKPEGDSFDVTLAEF